MVSSNQDDIIDDPLGIPYVPEVWQTGSSQSYFDEIQWREPTQNIQVFSLSPTSCTNLIQYLVKEYYIIPLNNENDKNNT